MGTEVLTIGEIILEEQLVVSDIVASWRNHQKSTNSSIKQPISKKNK